MRALAILSVGFLCYSFYQTQARGDDKEPGLISLKELKREIQKKYPVEWQPKGPLLHFNPKAKTEVLESAVLREYLPKTRFCVTTLTSDYMGVREVCTVFSASVSSGKVSLQECFDLMFTTVPKEFLAQFIGLLPKTPADRKSVALAIGELLAKPTGQLKNGRFEKSDFWMEICEGEGEDIWRYIVIKFDGKGRLQNVEELNPAELRKDGINH
jgi:hypothetical protein